MAFHFLQLEVANLPIAGQGRYASKRLNAQRFSLLLTSKHRQHEFFQWGLLHYLQQIHGPNHFS